MCQMGSSEPNSLDSFRYVSGQEVAGLGDCSGYGGPSRRLSHPNNGISLAPNSLVIYKDTPPGILGQFKGGDGV